MRRTQFDPRELKRCEERLFALRGAARKYQVPAEPTSSESGRIPAGHHGSGRRREGSVALEQAEAAAEQGYIAAAQALSAARKAAAATLELRRAEGTAAAQAGARAFHDADRG